MKKTYFLFFILMLIIFLFVVEKERKTYVIKVQDGDSIILSNGSKIRLFGIDAPELFQTCITKDKKEIECGKISQKILENFILGKEVHCEYKKIDRYKRKLAVCYLDKIDINKYMVRTGWAVAYKKFSSDYRNAEALAKKEKIGIWQWRFLFPETYRKKQRLKGIVYDNHR